MRLSSDITRRRLSNCGSARASALVLACVFLLAGTTPALAARAEGHTWFVGQLEHANRARSQVHPNSLAADLVDRLCDISDFTDRAYGDYLERSLEDYEQFLPPEKLAHLIQRHRERLHETVRARLVRDLSTWIVVSGEDDFQLIEASFDGEHGKVTVASTDHRMVLHLRRRDGNWRVVDASEDHRTLTEHFQSLVSDILDRDYSFAVLQARLQGREDIVIEDFAQATPGTLPEGWGWRQKRDDRKAKLYRVRETANKRYLAAQDTGASVILLKWSHWNPRTYPIMTWCWRADVLPPGGDERFTHTNDSAAGIYVIYSQNWLGLPRQIKYVWSTTLPEGTVDRRDMIARPYFFVLESGEARAGEWVFEMTDVEANYQRVFGSRPKDRTLGIGLLTDANSTDSYAEAYYADIRVWSREARDEGRIADYCGDLREPANGDDGHSRITTAGEE
ncbi:MAG: DUF3047 domain-containing protein [Gemmatimonadetes bacterium]|jgi:hypothetical protein|nr:DUF3047 domain-containing protein [Gemmatimonadota bacterium]MBT7860769.1 DUF3047 domain-containing protein [Gemmatimonadota bacterium]